MIFKKEDEIYHETNKTCHVCGKTCINKVRDHCHQTRKYRGPACKMCNLRYKQQTSFLYYSIMIVVMISYYYIVNSLKKIMIKEKLIAYL